MTDLRPRCISRSQLKTRLAELRGQPLSPPAGKVSVPAEPLESQEFPTQSKFKNQNSKIDFDPPDWSSFAEQTRLYEQEMAQQLFAAARQRILAIRAGVAPKSAFSEVARFTDLASRLARRAAGITDPSSETPQSAQADLLVQFEEAIKEICSTQAAGTSSASPNSIEHDSANPKSQ
jgi:hypothetical protein